MPYGELDKLSPESAFSYACTRCSACCVNKKIQINPFEIARLADNLGEKFTRFREKYTIEGVALKQREDGACVFLGEAGCTVHKDRPLVCRIFPLGRHIKENGEIFYTNPQWSPMPNGQYGAAGKVQDYIDDQGVTEFAAFADAYFRWYCKARDFAAADRETDTPFPYDDLLDIDAVVKQYCNINSFDLPPNVAERASLHLEILDSLVEGG